MRKSKPYRQKTSKKVFLNCLGKSVCCQNIFLPHKENYFLLGYMKETFPKLAFGSTENNFYKKTGVTVRNIFGEFFWKR